MRNELVITSNGEQLVSSTHDETNELYINGSVIDSALWVGTGNYEVTVEGYNVTIQKVADLNGNIILVKLNDYLYALKKSQSGSGGGGSYNDLTDKPQIEGVTLSGNKTYEELNLNRITNTEIEDLLTF